MSKHGKSSKTVKSRGVKPVLKWVGGKSQLLDKLMGNFPKNMHNYHEIFLGGGSVLLAFLTHLRINKKIEMTGNIYAYDLNEPLIGVYRNIQNSHEELYSEIGILIGHFNDCGEGEVNRKPVSLEEAKGCKENYYYWVRKEYNKLDAGGKTGIAGSAMFIFMNKTCFRGVFRVGPNGFNVPFGHNKNPEIVNRDHLTEVHKLIQGVNFVCGDFTTSLGNVTDEDYVYLDPPYAPGAEKSFVGYTEGGFNLDNHMNLFGILHTLTEKKQRFMLSNADVAIVRDNFGDERYNTTIVSARRTINSKNPGSMANEVVITNYCVGTKW